MNSLDLNHPPLHKNACDPRDASHNEELAFRDAHVMIVDDEAINIKLIRKVLREVGFHRFTDIVEPADVLATMRRDPPDLVLLDIMMPEISGLEVLEAIRSTQTLQNIPVIMLTASLDRATKLEALELAANDFLSKPVDRAELIPRIENVLRAQRRGDNLLAICDDLLNMLRSLTLSEIQRTELSAIKGRRDRCLGAMPRQHPPTVSSATAAEDAS